MAVTLNRSTFEHAKELINEGRFVFDERDAWSEHQPSSQQENEFIQRHGFAEYGKWNLGINNEKPEDTKGHYEFPYGDFKDVHRCGLLSADPYSVAGVEDSARLYAFVRKNPRLPGTCGPQYAGFHALAARGAVHLCAGKRDG